MTRRAFLLGLAMAAWVNLWPAYSSLIAHSSRADYAQLSEAFLIPFFCLLGLNLLLGRRGPGLLPSELLAISCMGMVAALMLGEWLSGYFLGIITAPPTLSRRRTDGTKSCSSTFPPGASWPTGSPPPDSTKVCRKTPPSPGRPGSPR